MAVLTAGQTDDAFDSALALYHLDEDTPYASCSLGGSAVLDLKYDADSFWALGDEALSIVQLDGSLAGQYDYGGRYLKAFSLGGDRSATLLLGKYRAGSGATLLTVDAAGQELAALELDDQVLDLDAAGRYVAVLTAGRLDLYTRDLELYASLDTTGRSPGRGAPLRRHRLAHHRGDRPSLHSRITARYLYDNCPISSSTSSFSSFWPCLPCWAPSVGCSSPCAACWLSSWPSSAPAPSQTSWPPRWPRT